MKLLEYEAKKILRSADLPAPEGVLIDSADQVESALEELGVNSGAVKAQVYAGGRGKAGGVKIFKNPQEATKMASEMLGMTLVTKQTGHQGVPVESVLIEEPADIAQEFYLTLMIDRGAAAPVMIVSQDGGMDIEEVAEKTPDRIHHLLLNYRQEVGEEVTRIVGGILQIETEESMLKLRSLLEGLYRVFQDTDCAMLEINPLVLTTQGDFVILDTKMDIDPNAYFRQGRIVISPNGDMTPAEVEASEHGLSYIQLEGDIGCMVNGAGLAMATMDIIMKYGHQPANFLDVGGSASEESVTEAFKIISSDPKVKVIMVNIFGGIMQCDVIAKGIVNAVEKVGLKVPLVVRLEGTNKDLGIKILDKSGLSIQSAKDMADAARLAGKAAEEASA